MSRVATCYRPNHRHVINTSCAWYIARHRRCHHLRRCPTQILTVPLVTTAEWSSRRSHSRVRTNPKRQHCSNWEDDNYDNGDDDTAMTTTTIVRKTDNGYSKTDRAYCNDKGVFPDARSWDLDSILCDGMEVVTNSLQDFGVWGRRTSVAYPPPTFDSQAAHSGSGSSGNDHDGEDASPASLVHAHVPRPPGFSREILLGLQNQEAAV
ncbi:hypothetical protein EDB85DRAFT_2276619 [Lactarius pseudohatsudake]|nr:hypothetical protein EDB85DRAFT_2276619 [Lactarius pseudohatsudake]